MASAVGASAVGACALLRPGRFAHAGGAAARRKFKYIDIHTHLGAFYPGQVLTAELLVRFMDAHGVEKSCVLPLVSPEAFWYPITTEFVLSQTKNHTDRLIPFCAIDPRTLGTHLTTQKQVVDMLKRYRDAVAAAASLYEGMRSFIRAQVLFSCRSRQSQINT